MNETHSYQGATAIPVTTITREFAEVMDGQWYEWHPRLNALVEPHVPSDRDMEQQFIRRLHKLVPGTECMSSKGAAARCVVVDGESYKRDHLYMRVSLPPLDLLGSGGDADIIRRAYLDAADLLADTIATQVAVMKLKHERVAVRWLSSGLMHHHAYDGTVRRLAVDMNRDGSVAIIAAYYVVAPIGNGGWA
jgi:hypothetical protein